jgi:hypothetical protein
MARRRNLTINDIPLYADDEDIGEAVLGWGRRKEFHGLATLLEDRGMPKISPLMKGRYVPAVKHFFDVYNGPRGTECATNTKRARGRRMDPRSTAEPARTQSRPTETHPASYRL